MASSFSIWGYVLKGCFWESVFWRAKSRLKGIEDSNLGMGAINVYEHLSFMAKRVAIVIDREVGRR